MTAREILALFATVGLLGAILVLAERIGGGRTGARAEVSRKVVHVASGLPAAAFPWLFSTTWSVAGLSAGYAALMAWTLRSGRLRSVHGVDRRTGGGFYYPAAVALVFHLAKGRPEAYVPSILVLALADAAAALVGSAFGRSRYSTLGGGKSVEGSLAFFVAALPCVAVPLLVLTALSAPAVLMWSALAAALTCAIEAAAPGGSDNLLVPTGCCLVLLRASSGPPPPGWILAASLAVLGTLFALGRDRDTVRGARAA